MEFNVRKDENYFLVPEMPTPNGRMHLGHVSGPYLKMDILKRKAKRNGGSAFTVSGSDVYESYVEIKSAQTGRDIEDICNDFHERIKLDLNALNIEMDLFLNPLDEDIHSDFVQHHQEMAQEIVDNGKSLDVDEDFFFDPENKRYLTGCWIQGKCPKCSAGTGSYLCENCGTHYKPMDIFDSKDYPTAIKRRKTSKFIKLDGDLMKSNLEKMGVESSFVQIFEEYIQSQGGKVRLTTEQQIGVSFGESDQVLYSYTSLWFFSVFCGEIATKRLGFAENPFLASSDFTTIASFGIDNAIPYLGGVYGAGLASEKYKPFDHLFSNFFYQLNGAKFSTSRLHVIWGKDVVDRAEISADLVRYYLALVNPQSETKNFDTHEFVSIANKRLVERHNPIIIDASQRMNANNNEGIEEAFPSKWFDQVEGILQKQDVALDPFNFQLSDFCSTIDEWFDFYENNDLTETEAYWWVKTYSLLINPVLSEMSQALANSLTRNSEITLQGFFDTQDNLRADLSHLQYAPVEIDKLDLCLVNNNV